MRLNLIHIAALVERTVKGDPRPRGKDGVLLSQNEHDLIIANEISFSHEPKKKNDEWGWFLWSWDKTDFQVSPSGAKYSGLADANCDNIFFMVEA